MWQYCFFSFQMSSEVLKICDPWQYHSNFLNESVYPNGRSVESFRPISLQVFFFFTCNKDQLFQA